MNELDDRLAAWNPVRAEDVRDASSSAEAAQLLHRILEQPAPSGPRRRLRQRRVRQPRWTRVSALAAVPALAAAVAAVAVIATAGITSPRPAGRAAPVGFQRGPSVGVASNAIELVRYSTRSAATTPVFVPDPRDWEYVEVRYGSHNAIGPGGVAETWQQVGGKRYAARWDHGKLTNGVGLGIGGLNGWPVTVNMANMYQYLASLPTQPAALRKVILANNHGSSAAAFTAIQNLFSNLPLLARFEAELYTVLVGLPGVHFTGDAVDTASRHGVGLYIAQDGGADEIIINPRTYAYMGSTDLTLHGSPSVNAVLAHPVSGPSATISESAAVLNSGIVSQAGQTP